MNTKKIYSFIALLAVATSTVFAEIVEYRTGPFDKLSVRGDINVVYRNLPDSVGYARYESDRNLDSAIELSASGGKLTIKEVMTDNHTKPLPTIYVYSDFLVSATNDGNATLLLEPGVASPKLSVKLVGNGRIICENVNSTQFSAGIETGAGTIVARGNCHKANFTLMGTGVIQADNLNAVDVNCKVVGTGTIGCRPQSNLNVKGIGTTKIFYYGTPVIKKMGGARIEHLEEGELPEALEQ
ncbi:MAG: DUF2807 domain-containing protein [Candidatus Amulumruptor caecigallinarius]|nr:DUF2807 domain-containing protein [Candidatus Amulumruptor caecigallinarius]